MDETIKKIVHASFALIALEMCGKLYWKDDSYWLDGGAVFVITYALCIVTDIMGVSSMAFVKNSYFRGLLSAMHGLDGAAACLIGNAVLWRNTAMICMGMLFMTKFCLIHLLNRMILAKNKTDNFLDGLTQTTKSFLHHVASFIFLRHPTEIIITTIWRTISMSGHAALVLRERISSKNMSACHWVLAYMRVSFQFLLLVLCYLSPQLRGEFAHSAVGHVAYMAVRIEPVFQQGSMYLTADEKAAWSALSTTEKLQHLCRGHHPWLAAELALLSTLIVLFSTWRVQLLVSEEESWVAQGEAPQGLVPSMADTALSLSRLSGQDYLRWFFASMAQ
jgi:hypothetical protein